MKKVVLLAVPLLFFIVLCGFLLSGLYSDPQYKNTSQLNRPLPPFKLADVMAPQQYYDQHLFDNHVTLLNVWGTWCVTCAVELPFLTELKLQGVRIVGLYYELDDDPDFGRKTLSQVQQDIRQRLTQLGNPYELNLWDGDRHYSLDLGVTGAPESFLIDQHGIIRLHHIGDINQRVWDEQIAPLYHQLDTSR